MEASEWFWVTPADVASAEGDTAPKSALPGMPGPIAENAEYAENAENVNISGLEDSPPPAEYAENGEHESFPLTTTTTLICQSGHRDCGGRRSPRPIGGSERQDQSPR